MATHRANIYFKKPYHRKIQVIKLLLQQDGKTLNDSIYEWLDKLWEYYQQKDKARFDEAVKTELAQEKERVFAQWEKEGYITPNKEEPSNQSPN